MSVETLKIIDCCSSSCSVDAKARLGETLKNVQNTIYDWLQRHRSRRALANLNDYLLADIGLTKEQVKDEIVKPFWIK